MVRLVASCQSTSTLSLFSLRFSTSCCCYNPSSASLESIPSYAHLEHTLRCSTHKRIHCINMQILADTQTHTFRLAAGSVHPLSQLLYRVSVSLLPPSVNSAAHWCRTQEPDTHLLNRLARVFSRPALNRRSVPTLH